MKTDVSPLEQLHNTLIWLQQSTLADWGVADADTEKHLRKHHPYPGLRAEAIMEIKALFKELVGEQFTFFVPLEDGKLVEVVEVKKLDKAIEEL